MIVTCGDTHGDIRRLNSGNVKHLCDDRYPDYVTILGDFGVIWSGNENDPSEQYWLKWLDEKPWTTIITRGNHENHERMNNYPLVDFCGGQAHQVGDKVFILRTGEFYLIDGKRIFNFGGALSIDKDQRANRISWWEEEIPTQAEYMRGVETLKAHPDIDYVFSHTAPLSIVKMIESKFPERLLLASLPDKLKDPTCQMLESFTEMMTFKEWRFGHFHFDAQLNEKFIVQYEKLRIID